jgi:RNA polymerase sigma-70 factor (ECF subfamily)
MHHSRQLIEMQTEEFQRLFYKMKDKLYRFSIRIVQDSAVAEDVVQEVMIKLWNKREKLAQIENAEGWLMVMTRNLSIDKIRSKHHKTGTLEAAYHVQDQNIKPDKQAEQSDLMKKIQEAVQFLPENQRMVFHLRDIEGMTYKEISAALDISLEKVKVNLHRARQKLRKQLKQVESYGIS